MQGSLILLFSLSVGVVLACRLPEPDCPEVYLTKQFDLAAYLGVWYEIARVPSSQFDSGACVTATYSLQEDTTYPVKVVNRQLLLHGRIFETREGGARLAEQADGDGSLVVYFPPVVFPSPPSKEANYFVLDTDYENYSVVFSCNERDGQFTRSSWILSRGRTLSAEAQTKVNAALARNMIDKSNYEMTDQSESLCKEDEDAEPEASDEQTP